MSRWYFFLFSFSILRRWARYISLLRCNITALPFVAPRATVLPLSFYMYIYTYSSLLYRIRSIPVLCPALRAGRAFVAPSFYLSSYHRIINNQLTAIFSFLAPSIISRFPAFALHRFVSYKMRRSILCVTIGTYKCKLNSLNSDESYNGSRPNLLG